MSPYLFPDRVFVVAKKAFKPLSTVALKSDWMLTGVIG